MDFVQMKEWVAFAKDVALLLGAVTTMGLGIYGVRIWKRDLVGKEVYAAIRVVVKQLHAVSRECRKYREPVRDDERRIMDTDEREHFTEGERWRLLEVEVYRNRAEELSASMDSLSDALLDARVLAGSKVYAACVPFQGQRVY